MHRDPVSGGTIRKLRPDERGELAAHFKRLDQNSRRMRFGHAVADAFIDAYVAGCDDQSGIVFGYFVDDELRAVAELRKRGALWTEEAEAAFSVEAEYQNCGLGTELMGRVIRAARNRNIHHLYVMCLADNTRMQRIARRHDAALRFSYGEVVGEIVPRGPNPFTMFEEALEDQRARIRMILDIHRRRSDEAA
jgi:GNAT superfamily N-acetyltransferase